MTTAPTENGRTVTAMNKIRDFCKKIGHEVVGRLTYYGKRNFCTRYWIDEAGNQYWINGALDSISIVGSRAKKE